MSILGIASKRLGLDLCLCFAASSGMQDVIAASGGELPVLVYDQDFESLADPLSEWSSTTTETTPAGGRRFLGQFGTQSVLLALQNLPVHSQVTIEFDLFIIRSWDGNDPGVGGSADIFRLGITNPTAQLLRTTFSNVTNDPKPQAFPDEYPGGKHPPADGASETNTLGYDFTPQIGDSVYQISKTFRHSADALTWDFSAVLDTPGANESWGLDNVQVWVAVPKARTPANQLASEAHETGRIGARLGRPCSN